MKVKHPQAGLAVVSLMVGAAVVSMLLNLYGDVERKMNQEFRAYGANVILTPTKTELDSTGSTSLSTVGGVMSEGALDRLKPFQARLRGFAAVPLLYVVARLRRVPSDPRLPEFQNAVVQGADFSALRSLNPGWRVEGDGAALQPGTCAIGAHIAAKLRAHVGAMLELEQVGVGIPAGPRRQQLRISNVLSTGASEDDQVFLPLDTLERWAGLEGKVSLVELSVPGKTAEVERAVRELAGAFPELEVRAIRQIVYSEGKVLRTLEWLLVSLAALIVVMIALCLMATMTAIVLERRKDIAMMKALGASERTVVQLFLSEGAGLGLIGGAGGFGFGVLLARDVAQRLFGVSLNILWWTLPVVCLSSAFLAALATTVLIGIVRGVEPAVVLKGE